MQRSRPNECAAGPVVAPQVHHDDMAIQLLVRELRDGREELEAVWNPRALDPIALEREKPGTYAPLLGTVELLRLAMALSGHGYSLERLELRHARGGPLDEQEESLMQSRLLALARARVDREILEYLDQMPTWVLVVGFEVSSSTDRRRIRVLRNGGVIAPTALDLGAFMNALRSSWSEVRPV
jgi:hypothetical protein